MKNIIVKKTDTEERIDQFLTGQFSELSRNQIRKMINDGSIKVNNGIIKPSYKIKAGDSIEYDLSATNNTIELEPEDIPLDIIYEDRDVIVLNKQAGIIVHPGGGNESGTLVNALINYYPDIKDAVLNEDSEVSKIRPGIVHRLDKDTTGVMIVAKNKSSLDFLKEQMSKREVEKIYLTFCLDNFPSKSGEINNLLIRNPKKRKEMSVSKNTKGKVAISKYRVVDNYNFSNHSICKVYFQILTGRTHQIRVHAKHLGSPVLGDKVYFNKESKELSKKLDLRRPILHSETLIIKIPSGEQKRFTAKTPKDIQDLIVKLS